MKFLGPLRAVARPRAEWSMPNFWDLDAPPVFTTWGLTPDKEPIGADFEAYVRQAYQACGVVFACITARQLVFSQARFLWREFGDNGRPGALFDSPELELLDRPWQNGTTGELLARLDLDAVVAGNFYATTADDDGHYGKSSKGGRNRRIVRMRPDWVTLVIAQPGVPAEQSDPFALDARVVALQYWPRGVSVGQDPSKAVILLPDEYAHFSPLPDPLARYRGMSWLTPIIREIEADKGATKHKLKYLQNAATPNLSVSLPKEMTPENFHKFTDIMDARHKGVSNAWKTLYTTGGADVKVIGADMKTLDFKAVQSYGETRIAAALRVHPVVGFLDSGMQGSSLNEGTAKVARRMWADGTIRPLWAMAAASLQTLVDPPTAKARLWYDDRDIPFLAEDAKDQAEVQTLQIAALNSGVTAGWDADAMVEFLHSGGDLTLLLGKHNGLPSVQQQSTDKLPLPPAPEGSPGAA